MTVIILGDYCYLVFLFWGFVVALGVFVLIQSHCISLAGLELPVFPRLVSNE